MVSAGHTTYWMGERESHREKWIGTGRKESEGERGRGRVVIRRRKWGREGKDVGWKGVCTCCSCASTEANCGRRLSVPAILSPADFSSAVLISTNWCINTSISLSLLNNTCKNQQVGNTLEIQYSIILENTLEEHTYMYCTWNSMCIHHQQKVIYTYIANKTQPRKSHRAYNTCIPIYTVIVYSMNVCRVAHLRDGLVPWFFILYLIYDIDYSMYQSITCRGHEWITRGILFPSLHMSQEWVTRVSDWIYHHLYNISWETNNCRGLLSKSVE